MNFLIEASSLDENINSLNEEGLLIDVFEDGRKSMDRFANIKSSSLLLYSLASIYAKEKNVDDCLVLNTHGRISDSTIANIFLVRNNFIITPALSEGAINGVMRRHLLKQIPSILPGVEVREGVVTKSDLEVFDEIFLTNAVQGIRWVKSYKGRNYRNEMAQKIYELLSFNL
jgi:branched-chain amino acid aminotransferase